MEEPVGVLEMNGAKPDVVCQRFTDGAWEAVPVHVPREMELAIYVNKQELVTILCTPTKLNCLVSGWLYSEGIISSMRDVASMRVCEDDSLADVILKDPAYKIPGRRILTSGCGAGASLTTQGRKVDSDLVVTATEVLNLMKQFQAKMELYRLSGGVHASALAGSGRLLIVAEDIGRHNTLDKIQGECLLKGVPTADRLLLSTGRVSSEMLLKASRMRVPVVVSRTSPTDRAVSLARELGVALVGYARGSRLTVYSHPERLGHPGRPMTGSGQSPLRAGAH